MKFNLGELWIRMDSILLQVDTEGYVNPDIQAIWDVMPLAGGVSLHNVRSVANI